MANYIFGANGLLLESGLFDSFGAFACIALIILVVKKIFGGVSE